MKKKQWRHQLKKVTSTVDQNNSDVTNWWKLWCRHKLIQYYDEPADKKLTSTTYIYIYILLIYLQLIYCMTIQLMTSLCGRILWRHQLIKPHEATSSLMCHEANNTHPPLPSHVICLQWLTVVIREPSWTVLARSQAPSTRAWWRIAASLPIILREPRHEFARAMENGVTRNQCVFVSKRIYTAVSHSRQQRRYENKVGRSGKANYGDTIWSISN